ncbi:MAG: hypothetical protein HC921_15835 [Synechococcaceae cyanobacterium SM2_3_1]|nr:hypothetical protein [Synechococcaceae cyanobacterium SM2_3_1]
MKKLIDFCGLPWHESCSSFYRSARKASTASRDQVRQPIYTRAVGRYKYYEPYLGKLKERLTADPEV